MGWLVGILLVAVGIIIGFFASRFTKSGNSSELSTKLEDTQNQFEAYRRDVADHMATARLLSDQVAEVQSRLNKFLGESEDFLQSDKEWQEPLPFFSESTIQELRQSNLLEPERERRRSDDIVNTDIDEPPRDYSEPGSGLFSPPKEEKV